MNGGWDLKKLEGKTIAILGSRKLEEMSTIIRNLGGEPYIRPAQGTVYLDHSQLKDDIYGLLDNQFEWGIFTTGIGIDTLYKAACELGEGEAFIAALKNMKIAARGYKTVNMLKKLGLTPVVRDDDGSTKGLVRMMKEHPLKGCKVALQLHGDPAPLLIEWLDGEQTHYKEILPYIHTPPETEVMEQLLSELLGDKVDAAFFTSTPQVRHLIAYAEEKGCLDDLIQAFQGRVIALAVGKVTAQALREAGIERVIFPENERMGSAIVELGNYYHSKKDI